MFAFMPSALPGTASPWLQNAGAPAPAAAADPAPAAQEAVNEQQPAAPAEAAAVANHWAEGETIGAPVTAAEAAKPAEEAKKPEDSKKPEESKDAILPDSMQATQVHAEQMEGILKAQYDAYKTAHPDDPAGDAQWQQALKGVHDQVELASTCAKVEKAGGTTQEVREKAAEVLNDRLVKAQEAGASPQDIENLQGQVKDANDRVAYGQSEAGKAADSAADLARPAQQARANEEKGQHDAYEHASKEEKEKACEAAAEIFGGSEGALTDFNKLAKAMKGKTPEQLKLMKGAFNEHFKDKFFDGRTIDDYIANAGVLELTPVHKAQLEAESRGDQAGTIVAEFADSAIGHGSFGASANPEAMNKSLEDLRKLRESGEEGKKKAEEVEAQLAKTWGKKSFDEVLDDRLGGRDLKLARTLTNEETNGHKTTEADIDLAELDVATHQGITNTTDNKKVREIMEKYSGSNKDGPNIEELKHAANNAGVDLNKLVVKDAGSDEDGHQQALLKAIVGDEDGKQDKVGMAAERMLLEFNPHKSETEDFLDAPHIKMDDKIFFDQFDKLKDPAEREATLARMTAEGLDYAKLLQGRLGLNATQAAHNLEVLKATGRLPTETTLALAMKDDDVELIK